MDLDLNTTLRLAAKARMSKFERQIKRLDPPGCGCTDCITSPPYSRPIDTVSDDLVISMLMGDVLNATGRNEFSLSIEMHSDFDTPTTVTDITLQREDF